jgi:hypothetical protein
LWWVSDGAIRFNAMGRKLKGCHSGMVRKHQTRNLEIPGSHFVRPGMTTQLGR